ncbi:ADR414Cp [Eremothecium gossypii ATCC 10895]|uniref:ADR414Cp n=1 Tax=Eremothecium gossypii (strain ATCC 10895 / CBS 109.51 / FGSC 9923 / NRRL Y-1056) TaxID=284811 RepID=Q758W4_EREGS|nr:ADR414Cp [Eremothecium gossypii ATCC 10895]AAS52333.1 ADR414Cp [Eremothecium gossypii ATCC 10895]AEY96630.1 FADR414Cp [Eremothecium gossypii FDAG1]
MVGSKSETQRRDSYLSPQRLEVQKSGTMSCMIPEEVRATYTQQYTAPRVQSYYVSSLRKPSRVDEEKAVNLERLKSYYSSRNATVCQVRGPGAMWTCRSSEGEGSTGSRRATTYGVEGGLQSQCPTDYEFGRHDHLGVMGSDLDTISGDMGRSYVKYYDKLSTINRDANYQLRKNNMWIPVCGEDYGRPVELLPSGLNYDRNDGMGLLETKELSPASVTNVPTSNELFMGGSTSLPLFGEKSLPSLIYHSSIELKNKIYILGGLTTCYKNDDGAPDLYDFHVDGIKNLPPPINDQLVNNPALLSNRRLYVVSANGFTLRIPKLSGQVPPPLLCGRISKLSDRYIFYYGGFEIRTETVIDEDTGKYYLSRRAFLNNTAYVLDVQLFKFVKVELVTQPTKFSAFSPTVPRFGHMQISVKMNNSISRCTESEDSKSTASSMRTGPQSYVSSAEDDCHQQSSEQTLSRVSTVSSTHAATIFIMGGYRQVDDHSYEALQDMWRVDVTVLSRGKKGYMKFAESASATLITRVGSDSKNSWPEPRAFMASCIVDSNLLNRTFSFEDTLRDAKDICTTPEETSQAIFANLPASAKVGRPANRDARQRTPLSGNKDAKTVIIHGGSDGSRVYGDMWWFDLADERWSRIALYSRDPDSGERRPIGLPAVGHSIFHSRDEFLLYGGLSQQDISSLFPEAPPFYRPREEPVDALNCSAAVIAIPSMTISPLDCSAHRDSTQHYTHLLSVSVLAIRGQLWLVGGAVASCSPTSITIALRGAISELTMPLTENSVARE